QKDEGVNRYYYLIKRKQRPQRQSSTKERISDGKPQPILRSIDATEEAEQQPQYLRRQPIVVSRTQPGWERRRHRFRLAAKLWEVLRALPVPKSFAPNERIGRKAVCLEPPPDLFR